MKCRHWGHFAYTCTATTDTCRTCGSKHKNKECSSKEKTYCISCKLNTHASWDRDCPEFRRRCEQYDENYPENSPPYFPTDEEWTLTPCPVRFQCSERFPAKYLVMALQQPEHSARAPAAKSQGKQHRQQPYKVPANQSTINRFINPESTQNTDTGKPTDNNNTDTAALSDANFPPLNNNTNPYAEDLNPQSWE
jgi:hypothetical protein